MGFSGGLTLRIYAGGGGVLVLSILKSFGAGVRLGMTLQIKLRGQFCYLQFLLIKLDVSGRLNSVHMFGTLSFVKFAGLVFSTLTISYLKGC